MKEQKEEYMGVWREERKRRDDVIKKKFLRRMSGIVPFTTGNSTLIPQEQNPGDPPLQSELRQEIPQRVGFPRTRSEEEAPAPVLSALL